MSQDSKLDEGFEKIKLSAAMSGDTSMTVYSGGKDVDHIRAKIFHHVEKCHRAEKRKLNLQDITCAN
jgi:thiamine biosynthesis protein ThiC